MVSQIPGPSRGRPQNPLPSGTPIPRCTGPLPTGDVQDLRRELQYRPLCTDFGIPLPPPYVIAEFPHGEPMRLDINLSRCRTVRLEHRMAGLIHGVLLRQCLIRALRLSMFKSDLWDTPADDLWQHPAEVEKRMKRGGKAKRRPAPNSRGLWRKKRCETAVELLQRDIRDLEVEYIYHWYDLRDVTYMRELKKEVEDGWERHAGPMGGSWTMRLADPGQLPQTS
ncbi:hypothetical protein JDV02_003261 [Purpureocillium takamizusanense]|uniref:Uncharacterized protein n=1 Tax=Purpureocillium takamizusanense TaxID=2060973 RepID=A0A9Q8V9H1_9HYPO|nr:uncharacterized protein JDV02_003261 [Purpureocillium takamizusanense]UNI16864.1 hypothetical protein JDV02_003261 [Purpureocillium takamizusanense]